MMHIHRAMQGRSYPNASSLAHDLEVSTKSIHRDLEFMRDRMDLPVAYDAARRGYYYSEEVSAFPTLQMTEGELCALLIAEKAVQQYRGTNFEKPLISAFRKLAASLPDTVTVSLADWEETISFRTSAEPILDLEIFDTLARATADRDQLRITYRRPGQQETVVRLVDPYHLANINGEWFLFGHCHLRKDIRTFVPARMSKVERTGKQFIRPRRFSLKNRLSDSFGVIAGEGLFTVAIRFDRWAADYIREKKWHASQRLTELPGGGVQLDLKLSSLTEIQRWVLGWGGHARVVSPPELEEGVRQAAEKILRQVSNGL